MSISLPNIKRSTLWYYVLFRFTNFSIKMSIRHNDWISVEHLVSLLPKRPTWAIKMQRLLSNYRFPIKFKRIEGLSYLIPYPLVLFFKMIPKEFHIFFTFITWGHIIKLINSVCIVSSKTCLIEDDDTTNNALHQYMLKCEGPCIICMYPWFRVNETFACIGLYYIWRLQMTEIKPFE